MKVTIIRFEGPNAICMKEDTSIIDIERVNIPADAEEGDKLNIEDSIITIEKQDIKKNYVHIDDIIIDI